MNLANSIRTSCGPVWSSVAFIAVVALTLVTTETSARADDETLDKIEKLSQKAMESFDLLDYEAAKKLLNGAVAKAKTAGLENEPIVAKVYLNLGIVFFSGEGDADSARVAFIDAVKIDPNIEIDAAYRTDDMKALLEEVKAEFGGGSDGGSSGSGVDCGSIEGLSHELIDTTAAGADREFVALVGSDMSVSKVSLFYRFHGGSDASPDFSELEMSVSDGCAYKATIPGAEIGNGVIHYYIAAFDDGGSEVASKGGERTPNIVEIESAGGGSDRDNPFGVSKGGGQKGPKGPAKIFVSAAFGTGAGLVTGETEQEFAEVNAGFAPALLHVFPEVGYYLSPKASVSVAVRLGFPIGANIDNHATAAVAGVVRYRQSLADNGEGLFWSAAAGGGMIRQTVTLAEPTDPDQDVDVTTIGPLFVGGSAGYAHPLSATMRFVAEMNVLIGLPVIKSIGPAPRLNFGAQFDFNLGMLLAF